MNGRSRDRAATEERILVAVGEVLARDGFHALGINAIAREAGIDKVLIYRYFGGLPELLKKWGASGHFWPTAEELLGQDGATVQALSVEARYALFFDRFIDALRARPLTIEILAAEIVERSELTAILETEREQWGEKVEMLFVGEAFNARPELRGITLLLVAGVQYLLVRARTIRVFGGIDLQSDAGWATLKASLNAASRPLLAPLGDSSEQPAAAVQKSARKKK
jgi:AcrR family transcriptional regulator